MNAPAIPKPRGHWSADAEKLIRQAYAQLVKGHKKDTLRAAENLRRMADKLFLEAHNKRSRDELFRPRVKLIEKHPSWRTGITLPSRVDRVVRF